MVCGVRWISRDGGRTRLTSNRCEMKISVWVDNDEYLGHIATFRVDVDRRPYYREPVLLSSLTSGRLESIVTVWLLRAMLTTCSSCVLADDHDQMARCQSRKKEKKNDDNAIWLNRRPLFRLNWNGPQSLTSQASWNFDATLAVVPCNFKRGKKLACPIMAMVGIGFGDTPDEEQSRERIRPNELAKGFYRTLHLVDSCGCE